MSEESIKIGRELFDLRVKILESDSLGIDWTVCDRVAKHIEKQDSDNARLRNAIEEHKAITGGFEDYDQKLYNALEGGV